MADDLPIEVAEDPNYPGVKTMEQVSGQPTGGVTGLKRVKPLETTGLWGYKGRDAAPAPTPPDTPQPSAAGTLAAGAKQLPGIWDRVQNDPQGIWDAISRGANKALGGGSVAQDTPTGSREAAPMPVTDPAPPAGAVPNAPAVNATSPNKPIEKLADILDNERQTNTLTAPAGSLVRKLEQDDKKDSAALPPLATPTTQKGPAPGLFGVPGLLGSLGENIHNWTDQRRMMLMALAGGLASGGGKGFGYNFGKGMTAAAAAMPEQQKLNTQNATVNYLMNNGLDRNQALAVMGNPQLAHEVLGQMSGILPPKTLDIEPGKSKVAWDARTGSYKPINMGAGGDFNTATSGPEWDAKSVDDKLKVIAAQYGQSFADVVKAAGEGRMIPSARQKEVHEIAATVYPGYNPISYQARQRAYVNFYGGGKADNQLKNFNQAFAQHAAGLPENMEANNNWKYGGSALNSPANRLGTAIGVNDTYTPLATNSKALVDEVANLWKFNGATDKEIEGWQTAIGDQLKNGTPIQQKKAAAELVRLGEGAVNALEEQKQREFGPAAAGLPALVSPQARAAIEKLKAWANDPNAKASVMQGGAQPSPQATNQADIVYQGGHFYQHMPDGSFKPYKPPQQQ